MLQKIYNIYSDDLSDAQLFIEAGKNHIACWCKKAGDNKLRAFEFFRCDDYTADDLEALLDNTRMLSKLLTMPVNSTNFFWNTDEVLCLPPGNDDAVFLEENFELMFGNLAGAKIFTAPATQCLVAWRIKNYQQQIAQQCFRGAVFSNNYVPLLTCFNGGKEHILYLFFYPHYFTLTAFKESKLLFAQTRKYNTPADVLYFILNVCRQYIIEKNVMIFCGGFIDENSKLYEVLYQYLQGLQLMHTDKNIFADEAFKEYSPHYFMPFINYAI